MVHYRRDIQGWDVLVGDLDKFIDIVCDRVIKKIQPYLPHSSPCPTININTDTNIETDPSMKHEAAKDNQISFLDLNGLSNAEIEKIEQILELNDTNDHEGTLKNATKVREDTTDTVENTIDKEVKEDPANERSNLIPEGKCNAAGYNAVTRAGGDGIDVGSQLGGYILAVPDKGGGGGGGGGGGHGGVVGH